MSYQPLFEKYNTLNVYDLYDKEWGILMYKYKNNILPQPFDNIYRIGKRT